MDLIEFSDSFELKKNHGPKETEMKKEVLTYCI